MAQSGAVRAGKAYVEFFADDSKLVRGMRAIERKLAKWGSRLSRIGSTMTAAGAMLAAPFAAAGLNIVQFGGYIDDMTHRTGMSVDAIQELAYAAHMGGSNMEEMEIAIRKMQNTLADGSKVFDKLGVSQSRLLELKADEQLAELADALVKVENPAERAAYAMDLFGRAGTKMLPLFQTGNKELDMLRKHFRSLGVAMSGEDVAKAAVLGDAFFDLKTAVFGAGQQIMFAIVPALTKMASMLAAAAAGVAQFAKNNRGLMVNLLMLGSLVVSIGPGLFIVSKVFSGLSFVFAGLAPLVSALVSPIGLVALGLISLGLMIAKQQGMWTEWITSAKQNLASLVADSQAAMSAIGNALASGNIAAAADVAFGLIKLKWLEATAFLTGKWSEFTTFFLNTWTFAVANAAKAFIFIWNGLQMLAINIAADIASAFLMAAEVAQKGWQTATNFIAKGLAFVIAKATGQDVDEVQKTLAEDQARSAAASSQSFDAARKSITKFRSEGIGALATAIDQQVAEVDAMAKQGVDARQGAMEEQKAAQQAAVDAARAGFEGAVAAANAPAETPGRPRRPRMDNLAASLQKTSSAGTFSAAAVRGLSGTKEVERIVKATEETARNTRQIMQPAFD
jgi:hypothetical protein